MSNTTTRGTQEYDGVRRDCHLCCMPIVEGDFVTYDGHDESGDAFSCHVHQWCDASLDYSQEGDVNPCTFCDVVGDWSLATLSEAVKGLPRAERARAFIFHKTQLLRRNHDGVWPSWDDVVKEGKSANFKLKAQDITVYTKPLVEFFKEEVCWQDTPVFYTDDFGNRTRSVLTSDPWLLGSGEPVVSHRGHSGGYLLSRFQFCHDVDPYQLMKANMEPLDVQDVKEILELHEIRYECDVNDTGRVCIVTKEPHVSLDVSFYPQPTPPRVRIFTHEDVSKSLGAFEGVVRQMQRMRLVLEALREKGILSTCDFATDEPDYDFIYPDSYRVEHSGFDGGHVHIVRDMVASKGAPRWVILNRYGERWDPVLASFFPCKNSDPSPHESFAFHEAKTIATGIRLKRKKAIKEMQKVVACDDQYDDDIPF